MLNTLKEFFKWVCKREEKVTMPQFPTISFELGWRKIVDVETQQAIIAKVYELCKDHNIKIWLAIKWLSTYIAIRPGELIKIKEGDIDIKARRLKLCYTKDKREKFIPLLDEDIELIKQFPPALPNVYFFRHPAGVSGAKEGQPFGNSLLRKWWKKAAFNLGIDDVDLYGGTRHSTARSMKAFASPEEIKKSTMHTTNRAFERYLMTEEEDIRRLYQKQRESLKSIQGKVLKMEVK